MSNPKIAIIYYSTYGTNHGVAQAAAKAAEEAGAEVRLRRIPETAPAEVVNGQDAWKAAAEAQSDIPEVSLDDVEWADGLFFSSPTRFGSVASQTRAFIDTLGPLWQRGALADKAVRRPRRPRTRTAAPRLPCRRFMSASCTGARSSCRRAIPIRSSSRMAATLTGSRPSRVPSTRSGSDRWPTSPSDWLPWRPNWQADRRNHARLPL